MLFTVSADISSLGRFDPAMLSDHNLMELFFTPENFDAAREVLGGDPDDCCTWAEVTCSPEGQITKINWCSYNVGKFAGSFDFLKFPKHMVNFNLYDEPFVGEVDFTALPETLLDVGLQRCAFSGTVDLGALPPDLRNIWIMGNQITALKNVCNLPPRLGCIIFQEENIQHESIRIGKLPQNGTVLRLQNCGFTDIQYEDPEDIESVFLF